jgi:hypothetical protein
MKKDIVTKLLDILKEQAFVTSTDSFSGEEEQLGPEIEDLEGTVVISGEFDRADLVEALKELFKH